MFPALVLSVAHVCMCVNFFFVSFNDSPLTCCLATPKPCSTCFYVTRSGLEQLLFS